MVLVFSITSRDSFRIAQEWLQYQRTRYNPFCKVVLVGNKADEAYKRTVFANEADTLAAQYGIPYVEISSTQYSEVYDLFVGLTRKIYSDVQEGKIPANYQKFGVREVNDFLANFTIVHSSRTRKANCC